MGRHHARIYSQLDECELVGVVDADAKRAGDIVEQWGGRAFESVEQLLEAGVDAVTIATPTIYHRDAAEQLLAAGVSCLIEKPLAPDVEQGRAMVAAAQRSKGILQVGHVVRYDPVMRAIRALPELHPRFIEMVRISPMTFRSVDVGVVLDMMIHDLDLLLMLVGEEPAEIHANAVCVLGEAEDVCNARLVFPPAEDGIACVANVTASRLALKTERKIRVICEDTYVSADFVNRKGTVIRKTANEAQLAEARARLAAGEDLSSINYLELVEVEDLAIGTADALTLQIQDFLDAVRTGRQPEVDARAGFAAVRTAERIVQTARAAGARMV
jgi:predicted dehydrogenase